MATKTIDERIAEIEAKENALKQKKKRLKAEQSRKVRNARTKRLIETGAVVEKAMGMEFDTEEKRKALMDFLESKKDYFQLQNFFDDLRI